jgi:hypothetical protein
LQGGDQSEGITFEAGHDDAKCGSDPVTGAEDRHGHRARTKTHLLVGSCEAMSADRRKLPEQPATVHDRVRRDPLQVLEDLGDDRLGCIREQHLADAGRMHWEAAADFAHHRH